LLAPDQPDNPHTCLWWPVLLTTKPIRTTHSGYTLEWKSDRLEAGDNNLTITDSHGADVPPTIFARRTEMGTLRQRLHPTPNHSHCFPPTLRPNPPHTTWMYHRPAPPPHPMGAILRLGTMETTASHTHAARTPRRSPQRFARRLAPERQVPEDVRLLLRDGHPQQDGYLSPITLT
jgi:hypothetical protein